MCLGIPGRVERFVEGSLPMAKVNFGGIIKDVCLVYTPEVAIGDYVIVHAGFSISKINEAEAQKVFSYLEQAGVVAEEISSKEEK